PFTPPPFSRRSCSHSPPPPPELRGGSSPTTAAGAAAPSSLSVLFSLFLEGPMDAYLYRSRSVKQPGIKQALKGVKATAKAAKGAIKGVPTHTTESPYFQSMLDAIAEAGLDNMHNDGEVMRGTMNVITRLARTMTERLDAMAEVERYKLKLGIYGGYEMTYAAQRLNPVE
ncbi:hypothetical protein Taro_034000, partial [Colocasia esculenta]|nr:hypothetical protein [Colocasia esculenta]